MIKYEYTGKNSQRAHITNFLYANSEKEARDTIAANGLSLESIRAVLAPNQEALLKSIADYEIINYYDDIEKSQQPEFNQLIYQNYVVRTNIGNEKYLYKISEKGKYHLEKAK